MYFILCGINSINTDSRQLILSDLLQGAWLQNPIRF